MEQKYTSTKLRVKFVTLRSYQSPLWRYILEKKEEEEEKMVKMTMKTKSRKRRRRRRRRRYVRTEATLISNIWDLGFGVRRVGEEIEGNDS